PWLRTHLGTGWAHGRTQGSGGRAEAGRGVVVGRVRGRRGGGAGETGPDDLAAGRGPADAPIAAEGLDEPETAAALVVEVDVAAFGGLVAGVPDLDDEFAVVEEQAEADVLGA